MKIKPLLYLTCMVISSKLATQAKILGIKTKMIITQFLLVYREAFIFFSCLTTMPAAG